MSSVFRKMLRELFDYVFMQRQPCSSQQLLQRQRLLGVLYSRRDKATWLGVGERLVRGWSEAERATLKWVKAIDRGPAQHHADSDLIAALQNLKAWETSRVQTAYFFGSWRLWVSSGLTSLCKIWWWDTRLAYARHCRDKRFREIPILLWDKARWLWKTYRRWFLLMWTYAVQSVPALRPPFNTD